MAKIVVIVDDSQTVHLSLEMAMEDLINSGEIDKKSYINPLDFVQDVKNGLVYDLCITDINMPEMNGLDLTKFLKSFPATQIKPILALTTESSDAIKEQGKEAGLTGWITKPFTADKVISAIKRVLRLR
ncbi:response regulator [Arcobacter sp. FWKO B]|uniref:response regulator n=1 Tax=Arcobacter sp. FWKO B TaxID=2593672 RepID=UPI0018A697EA|nr:response regulator [Arcobacter sp. FWKO B]QOG11209.1 response regulator [Arcobacter sp. FWKO B]